MVRTFFTTGVEILDQAIRLGNQAAPIEVELLQARMDAVRELAPVS